MAKTTHIPKGGFTVARQFFTSNVWRKDPLYIKLWIWIIGQANHQDVEKNGFRYYRGEVVTSYQEIIKSLAYTYNRRTIEPTTKKIRIMLQWLVDAGMIGVEPIRAEAEKSTDPELTGLGRTGAETRTETRAYIGIKIIVVNYDTYQNVDNYKGRHRDRNISEQGHNNNNDVNNNDTNNNTSLYEFYLQEINPAEKTRQRALKNITHHLKKYSPEALKNAISNYANIAGKREPRFRKNPANFFGKQEPAFFDYLSENFSPPATYHQRVESQKPLEEILS